MAGKRRHFGSVRKLPSGRFQASYLGGDGKRVPAPMTFANKADANAWLSNIEADKTQGVLRQPKGKSRALSEYAATWLDERPKPLRPNTRRQYEQLLRDHIAPELGSHVLTAIEPDAVRRWHAKLGRTDSPAVQATSYRLLHAILATAAEDGVITVNPCKIKSGGRVESAKRNPLNLDEIEKLAELVHPRYQALVLVAAYGGLRHGELIGLRRCDIDLDAGSVTVVWQLQREGSKWARVEPKSKAGRRTVHLPEHVVDVLRDHLDRYVGEGSESPVFTTVTGKPIYRGNMRLMLRRAGANIDRPHVFPHLLRHSGLTAAAHTGATTRELMVRGGHVSVETAMGYQHAAVERDQEIARKLNRTKSN